MNNKLVGIALAAALLAACGGGGGTGSNIPQGSGAAAPPASAAAVTFTIVIPARAASTAANRRALYVSPSTVSVVVTLTEQNGTPVTLAQPYAVTVSGISACHLAPRSVARSAQAARKPLTERQPCTFSIPEPVGVDTFSVSTYDAAQTSATPATLTGKLLSTGSVATTVVANAANTVTLTLGGVVAGFTLLLGDANPSTGSTQTISLVVEAKDADGNFIFGEGNYATPITLANSDLSGATTLSATTLTHPGNVTVTYTGAPTRATFAASATGATSATATLVSQISKIYVVNYSAGSVTTYNPDGTQTTPTITAGLSSPQGIAVDATGKIYVADSSNNTVTTYLPDGTQTTPTITGLDEPVGVAIDATGKIYVVDSSGDDVKTFLANGTQTTPTITGLNFPYAVAVAPNGNIYVGNGGNNTVTTFDAIGTQITPTLSIGDPNGMFIDSSGKLYVANFSGGGGGLNGSITTYLANGTQTTPTITAGVQTATGVAVDLTGNIYVSNYGSSTVTTYNADGSQTTPTITTGVNGPEGVAVY